MPIGCRIAAIDRLGPIELWIAPRNEVAVKVSNVAVSVGIDRVVGRVCVQLHDLLELGVVLCLDAAV